MVNFRECWKFTLAMPRCYPPYLASSLTSLLPGRNQRKNNTGAATANSKREEEEKGEVELGQGRAAVQDRPEGCAAHWTDTWVAATSSTYFL